jgi:hypothetical protein
VVDGPTPHSDAPSPVIPEDPRKGSSTTPARPDHDHDRGYRTGSVLCGCDTGATPMASASEQPGRTWDRDRQLVGRSTPWDTHERQVSLDSSVTVFFWRKVLAGGLIRAM